MMATGQTLEGIMPPLLVQLGKDSAAALRASGPPLALSLSSALAKATQSTAEEH